MKSKFRKYIDLQDKFQLFPHSWTFQKRSFPWRWAPALWRTKKQGNFLCFFWVMIFWCYGEFYVMASHGKVLTQIFYSQIDYIIGFKCYVLSWLKEQSTPPSPQLIFISNPVLISPSLNWLQHLQGLVQNENMGSFVQNVLRILRQWHQSIKLNVGPF